MHIGLSADVYEAVHYIRQQFPHAPVFLVGFSIGAYTMTKYVGEADSGVWPKGESCMAAHFRFFPWYVAFYAASRWAIGVETCCVHFVCISQHFCLFNSEHIYAGGTACRA